MTLTEFLLARIAEDEAALADWFETPHKAGCVAVSVDGYGDHVGLSTGECDCGYSPRVLAECEAKRRIVSDALVWLDGDDNDGTFSAVMARACYVRTLRLLARPYADHADYDPAWAWAV